MSKYLIYGLFCPFTNEPHYVGKSSSGMIRPLSHLTKSHSKQINKWVIQLKFLGYKPNIKILEECNKKNLDERELFWINKYRDDYYLLNSTHNTIKFILSKKQYNNIHDFFDIGNKIKNERKSLNYTQDKLAKLGGISRRTYVEIEKGNPKISLKNLTKILNVLGYKLTIEKKTTNESN